MNAATLRSFDELAAACGEALWPDTVTIASVDYAATVTPPALTTSIGPFAEEPGETPLTVRIRKVTLATAPAENAFLTWSARRWKIRSVIGAAATEAAWTLTCEPAP